MTFTPIWPIVSLEHIAHCDGNSQSCAPSSLGLSHSPCVGELCRCCPRYAPHVSHSIWVYLRWNLLSIILPLAEPARHNCHGEEGKRWWWDFAGCLSRSWHTSTPLFLAWITHSVLHSSVGFSFSRSRFKVSLLEEERPSQCAHSHTDNEDNTKTGVARCSQDSPNRIKSGGERT